MISPKEASRKSQEAEEKLNTESRKEAITLLPSVEELILETTKKGKYAVGYKINNDRILLQLEELLRDMGFGVRHSRDRDGWRTLLISWGGKANG